MYPNADIPVLEISVQPGHDARWHDRVGEALAPLRHENILIIGSGEPNLTHNLAAAFRGHHPQTPAWVTDFADWISDKVNNDDVQSLLDWQRLAPYAHQNHPTPQHFLRGAAKDAAQWPCLARGSPFWNLQSSHGLRPISVLAELLMEPFQILI